MSYWSHLWICLPIYHLYTLLSFIYLQQPSLQSIYEILHFCQVTTHLLDFQCFSFPAKNNFLLSTDSANTQLNLLVLAFLLIYKLLT